MNYPQSNFVQAGSYPPQQGLGLPLAPQSMMCGQQSSGMMPGMPSSIPSWAQQYNNPATAMMYRQFFDQGDFSRSGYLDQAGLQAALTAAGEY